MRPSPLLLSTALLLPAALFAQGVPGPTETGFLNRRVTVAGLEYPYQVYVPRDYSPDREWPVILSLHGAGERGADGLFPTAIGLASAVRRDPGRFPAIIVFPQAPLDSGWTGNPADAAMSALRETMRGYRTDPRRVYLTGLSMGGHGVWYLAYRYPEVFAAIAPVCGWVGEIRPYVGSVPVVPGDSGSAVVTLAHRLRNLPVWIFHGEIDRTIPVVNSREPAAALSAAGARVRYTEFPGMDHNTWDAAYGSRVFTEWLFAQRRN